MSVKENLIFKFKNKNLDHSVLLLELLSSKYCQNGGGLTYKEIIEIFNFNNRPINEKKIRDLLGVWKKRKKCDITKKEKNLAYFIIPKSKQDFEEKEYVDFFSLLKIHPKIKEVSSELFEDGYYSQAILEAFKKVNSVVKSKTKREDIDGKSLMQHTFSRNSPLIKLNKLETITDKDEQEGYMYLFSGAMMGIRNPKAHKIIIQKDKVKTLKFLSFASLLLEKLDEANSYN